MREEYLYCCNTIIKEDNIIYFYSHPYFLLLRANIETGQIVPVFSPKGKGYYRSFIKEDDEIIFFPENIGDYCIYNVKERKAKYIDFPKELHLKTENNWSGNYIQLGHLIFFFWASKVVTIYNKETRTWEVVRNFELENSCRGINVRTFAGAFTKNESVYFVLCNTFSLLRYDSVNNKASTYRIENISSDYSLQKACFYNETLWLVAKKSRRIASVMRVDDIENPIAKEVYTIELDKDSDYTFADIVVTDHSLWLLPEFYDRSYRIDIQKKEISEIKDIPCVENNELVKRDDPRNYLYGVRIEQCYYTINLQLGILVIIDLNKDQINTVQLHFSENTYNIALKEIYNKEIVKESNAYNINEWLITI